jgi:pyruvate,water dikinase
MRKAKRRAYRGVNVVSESLAAGRGVDGDATLDPLHGASYPDSMWSTTNMAEAMPGVLTPLDWTVVGAIGEGAVRRGFHAFGVLPRREIELPARVEERMAGIFYGRAALRVDFFCRMGDRLPGTSGAAAAEQLFGSVPPGLVSKPARRYYPVVAVRLPAAWARAPKRVREARALTEKWRQSELPRIATADRAEAHGRFVAALARFEDDCNHHILATFAVVQPVFDQLTRLAASVGEGGSALMAGYGGHDETRMVMDLWACSRGQLDFDVFLATHGYHGPREGEISGVVWREDPAPLLQILEGYRALGADADPVAAELARVAERERAEQELLAALPAARRAWARAVLRLARRYVPLRGVGKAAFLQALDVARAAARRLGTCLAAEGVLDDPADIFFLTRDEICLSRWEGAKELVQFRRGRREAYRLLELPGTWQGMPEPHPAGEFEEGGDVLEGVAASPGVVEGRVRVLVDPGETAMETGEILVAHVTDPSWASVLFLSSALVTDIGGLLSHAAVVARELGVPCVAGTRVGTKVLRTGDRCRVNGTTGRIEVLERAENAETGG